MGAKLVEYYEKAKQLGGLKASMRLAMLTQCSSKSAETEPDSAELIKKFDDAYVELKKEFN